MSYKRFFAMIITSTVIMFGLMYSTVYTADHVWWSQTKFWMALYMGAVMAVVMLAFMWKMYDDRRANLAIVAGSALVFAVALWLARSQAAVGDVAWMKAMIPHHSIAVLTSERASISDPRVRRLADDIILAQRREIAEMEAFIADLEGSDVEGEILPPDVPPVEGGSAELTGPVPGAPALFLGAAPLVGDVLVVDSVKVVSDAWLVVHPAGEGGRPDVSQIVGRAFVQHGVSEDVPVELSGAEAGVPLVVMLHDDTGAIGRFEFGSGEADGPLLRDGAPVLATVQP
ncbi:DUF305 domain-containing protein [Rubrivirga marina]|uniref:DUF305 domain-containing protein n=1 Tax=Rubrivirga marina TaxID=1196024 RepID=UPI0015C941A2|nr:DUF305 domain-containing protein [Rubrivirga marina]